MDKILLTPAYLAGWYWLLDGWQSQHAVRSERFEPPRDGGSKGGIFDRMEGAHSV
jgi:hypothetical protein